MYSIPDTHIPIFATAFSSLVQASQLAAEECLNRKYQLTSENEQKQQGCLSIALLSPRVRECSVDNRSPCDCAWGPLRDITFCCLVNYCLVSPQDALLQLAADCVALIVPPPFSLERGICPENDITTTSHIIELTSSIMLSTSRGSSTFNSKPTINISTPSSPSPTTALPATSPQPSPSSLQKTTAGDSPAKDKKKKLGLILGLSVPAAIFAIAAIFFWIRRQKSKKKMTAAEAGDEQKSSGLSKERLSGIQEEAGGCSGYNNNDNKEKASRLSELHSDSIPPYSTELPGTPAPQLIELPG